MEISLLTMKVHDQAISIRNGRIISAEAPRNYLLSVTEFTLKRYLATLKHRSIELKCGWIIALNTVFS